MSRVGAVALLLVGYGLIAVGAWAKPANPSPRRAVGSQAASPLPAISRDEPLPGAYQDLVRRMVQKGPGDTLGDGLFALAEESFRAGAFDEASKRYSEFCQRFTRNLRMNEALERLLMIRSSRDFEDEPLKIYARAESLRHSGLLDSAKTTLTNGLTRYPGARLRWHFRFALAEIARDKGDHAGAIEQALAVADTAAVSRLAPYALKLAGDETLASGGPRERAVGYYQALLERFPDSPLAPSVRAQVLLLRKRMQL